MMLLCSNSSTIYCVE